MAMVSAKTGDMHQARDDEQKHWHERWHTWHSISLVIGSAKEKISNTSRLLSITVEQTRKVRCYIIDCSLLTMFLALILWSLGQCYLSSWNGLRLPQDCLYSIATIWSLLLTYYCRNIRACSGRPYASVVKLFWDPIQAKVKRLPGRDQKIGFFSASHSRYFVKNAFHNWNKIIGIKL